MKYEVQTDQHQSVSPEVDHKLTAKKEKSRLSAIFTVVFSGKPSLLPPFATLLHYHFFFKL